MYRRVALGLGALSSASCTALFIPVAFAAEKPEFPPVYDEEVQFLADPLAGSTVESASDKTALSKAESKIGQELDLHTVQASGRVLQVSELLEGYVRNARKFVDRTLTKAEEKSAVYGQKYRESERSAAETVASLKSDHEDLLPSSIYVLVAGLSGSIVTRRSNILLRATVPWIFGAGAFAYFLPESWANVRALTWKYEQDKAPAFAKKHAETHETISDLTKQTADLYGESEKQVKSSMSSLRSKIKQWTGY